jgi:ribosome-binding factor A
MVVSRSAKGAKKPSGPSQRQLRVSEQLRHVLIETLQRGKFHDAALLDAGQSVTITEVRVTPDLKNAYAFVLMLNGADIEVVLPALNESAQIFQREFAKKLNLKFTPKVKFRNDSSFENARRIDEILYNLPKTSEADLIDIDDMDDDDYDNEK